MFMAAENEPDPRSERYIYVRYCRSKSEKEIQQMDTKRTDRIANQLFVITVAVLVAAMLVSGISVYAAGRIRAEVGSHLLETQTEEECLKEAPM